MKKKINNILSPFFLGCVILLSCDDNSHFSITETSCNYKTFATGVQSPVRFGWKLYSDLNNQKQAARQILVSDNLEELQKNKGNVWNSGKVNSSESVNIFVTNLNLKPGNIYFWKVKVWSEEGGESNWSEPDTIITALDDENWKSAKWLSLEEMDDSLVLVPGIPTWGHNTKDVAARRPIVPVFRKEFSTEKKVKSALLFISGLGQYKAYINGKQISDDFLTPGWTHYHKTCLYNTYDITKEIQNGKNALGAIVGNGFYNINNERYRKLLITYGMPKLIAKLKIEYTDGTSEEINTDESWKTTASPITYTSIYGGECYDARLEQEGWSEPGFDDNHWSHVLQAKEPGGKLYQQTIYPIKSMEQYKPGEIVKVDDNSFLVDFNQNASGIFEIKVKGNKGDTVKLVPSELINEDNSVFQKFIGSPHYYEYILKGEGVETWQPKFSYFGFRYLQVFGAQPSSFKKEEGKTELLNITMAHTYNATPHTGSFWCSNPLFNQIDTIIRYAMQSNMQSILTDCPHREKLGWTEQTYLLGNSLQHNFMMYHLYNKLVNDMMDSQRENGLIGSIAPEYIIFGNEFTDSPEWGSAIIMVPWLMYKFYGDVSLIEKAWESMIKYMGYLDSKANNHILSYGLGDWYDLGPNPPGFSQLSPIATTATSIYYYNYKVLAQMARQIGKEPEAGEFEDKAGLIRNAYNKKLFNPEVGVYGSGSQTSMAIPLSMGIVTKKYRKKVLQNLVDSLLLNNKALTAGDIGFHYLIDALTEGNQAQLIYDMNNRDNVPGYGYQIKKGATALTESWDALRTKSNNHMMLGHIEEWFYTSLGGIRQEEKSAGYKHIVIKPSFVNGLDEVKTSYESVYGTIVSEWKKENTSITMQVEIPVNTSAKVFIPVSDLSNVKLNNTLVPDSQEIISSQTNENESVIQVGSGKYTIKFNLISKPLVKSSFQGDLGSH